METKYYEYVGTQEQADAYRNPAPIIGNIYPESAEIGGAKVHYWATNSFYQVPKEWKLVEKELSTHELIELLNKMAAKDGMTCSVTFDKKPGVEITDFEVSDPHYDGLTRVRFFVNLNPLQVQSKQSQLIEAIKNVLEND